MKPKLTDSNYNHIIFSIYNHVHWLARHPEIVMLPNKISTENLIN